VVPKGEEFPPGASQKSPHEHKPPRTAISATAPSIARQPRRRAGIPRKKSKAITAPPLAPIHPPRRGRTSWLLVAAVLATVAVSVPLVALALSTTVELESAQVGASVTVEGLDEVSEQLSVAVPT
jgi:hypothetical protein